MGGDEGFAPLPPPLLRKYIAYARQHVHPVLSAAAAAVLRAYWLELRQRSSGIEGLPITVCCGAQWPRKLQCILSFC